MQASYSLCMVILLLFCVCFIGLHVYIAFIATVSATVGKR